MQPKEIMQELKASSEFKKWKRAHKNSYLSHIFYEILNKKQESLQIGYYNPEQDTITSFSHPNWDSKEDEVFKESGVVPELDLDEVTTNEEEILKLARQELEKTPNYTKLIIILQHVDDITLWNITTTTTTMQTVNIKFNASTGKLIKYDVLTLNDLSNQDYIG